MSLRISYLKTRLKLSQYFQEDVAKDSVFLHHTGGGGAEEAVQWWNQTPDRVGTALFVDREGRALQDFEIAHWAYHLGIAGVKNDRDKKSVGIEIISYGFVLPEGEGKDLKYYAYPLYPNMKQRVRIANDQVVELDQAWRGFKFWHKYTDAQVETIVLLLQYLVKRFNIKVQKDITNFWEYDASVAKENKPGIWSHTTVRKDGKWDIFPQPNLIEAIYKAFKTTK